MSDCEDACGRLRIGDLKRIAASFDATTGVLTVGEALGTRHSALGTRRSAGVAGATEVG